MAITRPPLTLVQPIGINVPKNPVKTDGARLLVMEETSIPPEIILVGGSYDSSQGVLTLVFDSGRTLQISGFLTVSGVGIGEKGDSGLNGLDGLPGVDGVNGMQGLRGATGPQGLKGEQGVIGNDGRPGDRGAAGEQGETGPGGENCGSGTGTGTGTGSLVDHTHSLSDLEATGDLSNLTYLRGDGEWAELPPFADLYHAHTVDDIVANGTVPTISTYLRGDGKWMPLPPQAAPLPHIHPVNEIATTGGVAGNTTFLRGDGTWSEVPHPPKAHTHTFSQIVFNGGIPNSTTFLRGDGVWTYIPLSSGGGAIDPHTHTIQDIATANSPSVSTFLRGNGTWSTVPVASHTHSVDDMSVDGTPDDNTYLTGNNSWSNPIVDSSYDYATDITGVETIVVNQGGTGKRVTLNQIITLGKGGSIVNLGSVSGAVSLDLAQGDTFLLSLIGATTINVTNKPASAPYQFVVRIKQAGIGNYSVVWDSEFKHPNNVAPAIGTDVGDSDIFVAHCFETGRLELLKASGPFKV